MSIISLGVFQHTSQTAGSPVTFLLWVIEEIMLERKVLRGYARCKWHDINGVNGTQSTGTWKTLSGEQKCSSWSSVDYTPTLPPFTGDKSNTKLAVQFEKSAKQTCWRFSTVMETTTNQVIIIESNNFEMSVPQWKNFDQNELGL